MSAIFKEIDLGWKGERYTIQPNMRMVQAIEQDVSIAGLVHRISKGDLPLSHVAFVLSFLLRSGGARDATQESVYQALYDNEDLLFRAVRAIESAFLPSGNSDSPDPSAAGTGKKESRKKDGRKSTGATSTTP